MIRIFFLKLLWLYRHSFSLVTRGACRHYPSCSEYALWQFERNTLPRAFIPRFYEFYGAINFFPAVLIIRLSTNRC
jgi:uncharacterized protein